VKNVEEWLAKSDRKLPKKAEAPFKTGYRPEIDVSRELVGDEASYCQSLIGILRWIVELGQIDICLEVSLMRSCGICACVEIQVANAGYSSGGAAFIFGDNKSVPMSAGAKRNGFVKKILQHIFRKNDED